MTVDLLLGLQWGDEGKGKIVDILAENYDIIARFQGGPNAGHTLKFDNIHHVLRTIPSGIFQKGTINIIGNGVVIDPVILINELKKLPPFDIDYPSQLLISKKAHLILPTHRLLDAASELAKGKSKIGSTLKGIGPAYMDKTGRNGIRVGDLEFENWKEKYRALTEKHQDIIKFYHFEIDNEFDHMEREFFDAIEALKKLHFIDSEEYLNKAMRSNKKILAEGAQGSLLDIDFGTYPFVTSSNTTSSGACTGLGIAPNKIKEVYGVFKSYTTRVGSGPFPTELTNEIGDKIAEIGNEFGSVTSRKRRCGWLDLVALKYACQINGVTKLIMMKSDVLSAFDELKICTSYQYRGRVIEYFPFNIDPENIKPIYTSFPCWKINLTDITDERQLPEELKNYISFIEKQLEISINMVSIGPDRRQTISLRSC